MDINITKILELEDTKAYVEDIDNGIIRPEDVGYNDMEDIEGDAAEELEAFGCLYL